MNTKARPHYSLNEVKRLIREKKIAFSLNSSSDSRRLGFTKQAVIECLLKLSVLNHFIKSTYYPPNDKHPYPLEWQDAYRCTFEGKDIYLKFAIRGNQVVLLTSFKSDERA